MGCIQTFFVSNAQPLSKSRESARVRTMRSERNGSAPSPARKTSCCQINRTKRIETATHDKRRSSVMISSQVAIRPSTKTRQVASCMTVCIEFLAGCMSVASCIFYASALFAVLRMAIFTARALVVFLLLVAHPPRSLEHNSSNVFSCMHIKALLCM